MERGREGEGGRGGERERGRERTGRVVGARCEEKEGGKSECECDGTLTIRMEPTKRIVFVRCA